ncbi:hypothetical protein KUTeg_024584 [Tegillarca granosa]|uniref:Mitochondria-eating protein C-terminal domain-containing protein n=1 Tax=Tegillarca granosa TaxID=220873 RepID=A0ABQ9DXT3_TEGGR|nr:hypothetical protein KUTeg_024584 [Tegillarca granosa]
MSNKLLKRRDNEKGIFMYKISGIYFVSDQVRLVQYNGDFVLNSQHQQAIYRTGNVVMTINAQKLKESQERIEQLLKEKQAFNSNVVTEIYTQFKDSAIKIRNGQAADIKSSTKKLETCLKDEGSYKHVKTEFDRIKRDIDEVTDLAEHMTEERKRNTKLTQGRGGLESKPRATTVTLSQQHTRQIARSLKDVGPIINRPVIGKNEPANNKKEGILSKLKNSQSKDEAIANKARKDETISRDKKDVTPSKIKKEPILEIKGETVPSEDIATLNKMISRLFSQLEIDSGGVSKNPKPSLTKQSTQKQQQQQQSAISSALQVKRLKPEEKEINLKYVIDRLKQFEDELAKRNTPKSNPNESLRVLSLQNEVQKLEKQLSDQSKQLDRFRGLQAITNKAKGKHVERIEERHQTEKKDMEIKIQELEKDLKKNVQGTMREKQDLENKVSQDFTRIRQEIYRLHSIVEKEQTNDSTRSSKTKNVSKENVSNLETDEMLEKIKNIGNEIQALRESNYQLTKTVEEKSEWEESFKDLEKEVETFCFDISEGSTFPRSEFDSAEALKGLRTSKTHAGPSKWKLNKAKTLLLNFVRKSEETERVMWAKTNEVDDAQIRLKEITAKIEKIYDHIKSHEAMVLDDSLSVQKGSLASGVKDIRTENKIEESSENITGSQKIEYVEKSIHWYESLLKVQNKALKQNENDFDLMYEKISNHQTKVIKDKKVLHQNELFLKMKRIGLNSVTKAKDYLEETSKELTELCVQHGVPDNLITGTGDEDSIDKIRRKINLCRTELSKTIEELHVKESKYKKCLTDVENIAKEVHTIFLNTLEESSDKREEKEKKEVQPKLVIVELKTINEHYSKLQDNVKKLKRLRDDANQKNTENTRLQLELQSRYTSNLGKSDDEKIYLRNKIDDLQRKLETAEHNLSDALTEKFNLLTRISASAGTKLTDDNPMIANLSDPNRPTKLAEKYSELYDNEWTNAYETLRNQFYMEEKDAITSLLAVIKSLASRQSDEIFKVLLLLHVDGIAEPGFKEGMQKISKETKKQVKDIRRAVAPNTLATVLGLYLSSDTEKTLTEDQMQACEPYIGQCVQLCWLMCVQDPPVYISWNLESGAKFSSDLYRHYTKTGYTVDYLVWPALRLHRDGPLLCKGVAQGK